MTAAAFAKGFLALEGELTPILVQMVKSGTHTNGLRHLLLNVMFVLRKLEMC